MYLHLSHDEKFIDAARAAFEAAAPGQHEFVVVDAVGRLKYIKTFEPQRLSLGEVVDSGFLSKLPDYDAVFLHSLNKPNRLVVDRAPADTHFIWLGWGYDYYGLIRAPAELLLSGTRALMQQLIGDAKADSVLTLAKAALMTPNRIRSGLRSRRIGPGGRDEYELLQKIAFFSPVLPTEDALIRARHPGFRPRYASWNYGVHDIVDAVSTAAAKREHRVIVGNNATPGCNHLEAFEALSAFDGEIVVPLSYGDAIYRDAILRAGRARLGDRFRPLTEYMTSDAYARLIAESSHLVMNHLRQQGLTNILIALRAGTRVVMQPENPLFSYLCDMGMFVDEMAGGLIPAPLPQDVIDRNRASVLEQFGAEKHHRRTCAFLAEIDSARVRPCIQ